eukprot:scaffold1847_cov343-Prasinococcus_capsulatus_cf.AAC.13
MQTGGAGAAAGAPAQLLPREPGARRKLAAGPHWPDVRPTFAELLRPARAATHGRGGQGDGAAGAGAREEGGAGAGAAVFRAAARAAQRPAQPRARLPHLPHMPGHLPHLHQHRLPAAGTPERLKSASSQTLLAQRAASTRAWLLASVRPGDADTAAGAWAGAVAHAALRGLVRCRLRTVRARRGANARVGGARRAPAQLRSGRAHAVGLPAHDALPRARRCAR